MASDNTSSICDILGTPNVSKLSSNVEEIEKTHPDALEDSNTVSVKPILNQDTPPPSENSTIKSSLEISAVPKPNNLFEILIKKVESVNNSTLEESSCTTERTKEQRSIDTNIKTTTEMNGTLSNGEAGSENHEQENGMQSNLSSHRSIFEHLRKNFRVSEDSPRTTPEESSRQSETLPTRPSDKDVTSSFGTTVNESTSRETDFDGENTSRSTVKAQMNSILVENNSISTSESCNTNENCQELNLNDGKDFPFTKRLKWISQRSREGSPSLLQQQQMPIEVEQENVITSVISSSYDDETATKKTNGISMDSTRTSVIKSAVAPHSPKELGFQPLLNDNQSTTCGSVSLRLHDGKTEVTQVLRGSDNVKSLETVRTPANDVHFVLDSSPSRVLELSRSVTSTNGNVKIPSENSRNLVTETGQFHVLPAESRKQVYSVVRSPSLNGGFVNGVARTTGKKFINLNEQNPQIFNDEQRLPINGNYVPQSTVDLSSTIYSKSPIHSKAFSPMWDRRSVVTSSLPIHRVPASVQLCYDNGFTATSTFGSPVYHPRTRGSPVVYGSQNQLFQPLQMQPRQEMNYSTRFYQNPGVTAVSQNILYSCNEYITKSPPPYTVSERVFRPVSPQWPQVLYTTNMSSGANSFAQVIKSEPTISDEDRDEYSYACALHESANSPDIERMLGSESPDKNISTENSSSSSEISSKESKYSKLKPSIEFISSHERTTSHSTSSTSSETARYSKRVTEFPRTTSPGSARTDIRYGDSSPKTDSLTSRCCEKVVKATKEDSLDSCKKEKIKNEPKEDETNSAIEQQKKRKTNLNVIHKRLEPKLPSPERETSSGDLYRDPSKLTREERALQRAMMQFSEMEMKEKVAPALPKKKRVKKNKTNKNNVETNPVERKGKLASSTWLLNVKRKQRNWLANRESKLKKSKEEPSDSVKKPSEDSPGVKVEPQLSICVQTEQNKKTLIKKRKRNDDQNHKNTSRKHREFPKERKTNQSEKVFKETIEVSTNPGEPHLDTPTDDPPKKKKKKIKKLIKKRRENEEHDSTTQLTSKNHVVDTDTLTSGNSNMLQPTTNSRKRSLDSSIERSHRVKTYMLVPSYQGFKDFQPIVIKSRTRNKRNVQPDETAKSSEKPNVPLLVVESVNSKPVKEMVVAETEEVQRLVTECLRMHGKWHGDELEQALKREETRLNEEENKHRDTKRLSVNRTTGETILHKAARLGYDEVVKQCILRGADPNARDNAGWTPLHEACARGKLAVVRVLARYGANVNAASNDGIRPIHDAAEAGHVNVIRVLLSYGADPMLATYAGNNALACAKEPKTKKFLRDYCIDVGLENPINIEDKTDGWEFSCSTRLSDASEFPDRVSGIWEDIPDCSDSFVPEFEVSDKPHLTTYNLPVLKDDVVVGRRNYILVQEFYDSGLVAKTTIQKKIKNIETLKMPWSRFLDIISENHLGVKPSYSPEGSSKDEPTAELIPLNYTIRRLLGIRIERCR
ncbi:BCL-6 corepressor-like isoform X2 [Actinia tenebrosa]|uniref:BCL-6 corepressor-like isoform X2 n=1 Tax=Actinia tenebrosa TaxID=6105 RepID=A0A6P8II43_ACTTE|nr:BCL-6 corepressor-like isoform X2 [Actinia tenebrosa]